MGALADIWNSERGLFAFFVMLCITVMAALGRITFDQWVEITKWVSGFYIGSKTVTSAVIALKQGATDPPTIIK